MKDKKIMWSGEIAKNFDAMNFRWLETFTTMHLRVVNNIYKLV